MTEVKRNNTDNKDIYSINFRLADIVTNMWIYLIKTYICLTCRKYEAKDYLTITQYMFMKGYGTIERDLNNMDVLTTIKKFEATMKHLVDKTNELDNAMWYAVLKSAGTEGKRIDVMDSVYNTFTDL